MADSHDDELQTPSRPPLGLLAFRAPEDRPPLIPSPSLPLEDQTTTGEPLEAGRPSPSAGEWQPDEPSDADESGTTSSPESSADGGVGPVLGKQALKRTFRKGVLITAGTAHKFGARTEGQRAAGLYLADPEDAENIGDPLAEIAHRRGGLGGGKLSPDANNAIQAAMGLAAYVAKQFAVATRALELDAQLAGQAPAGGPVDV